MKSLQNIIDKLSPTEINNFRLFLSGHARTARNKKLELFNQLVDHKNTTSETPARHLLLKEPSSRQALYQLKKRLQDELYSFLISLSQYRSYRDQLSQEMECHRKLYCVKILMDKGVHQHAAQILDQVLDVAMKHSLNTIYLEAVNLKNIYFPTVQNKQNKIQVSVHIRKLKKKVSRNLYVQHYLSGSASGPFENDAEFRMKLMKDLLDAELTAEPVVNEFITVSSHFYHRDFTSAKSKLEDMISLSADISGDRALQGILYIELIKANLCLNDLYEAKAWLNKAERAASSYDAFSGLLHELAFTLYLRDNDLQKQKQVIEHHNHTPLSEEQNDISSGRWSYFRIFYYFAKADHRAVIKLANEQSGFLKKHKNWLYYIRLLEIFSVYHLQDWDWLYHKMESLRKTPFARSPRAVQMIKLLKECLLQRRSAPGNIEEKINQLEKHHPWHPLGIELFNFCDYLKSVT